MKIKEAPIYKRNRRQRHRHKQNVYLLLLVKFVALIGLSLASGDLVKASKSLIEVNQNSQFAINSSSSSATTTTNRNPTRGQQQETNSKQPTNERINLIEADQYGLYLVGLFDIHHSNPRFPFKCGPIDVDVGEWHSRRPMQNMEAFLWAIAQVNADKSLLPGVRLGSLVMDTCSSFLRTNQQLANLLHGGGNPHPANGKVTSNRQIAAIVADNSDWQSVEAVVSMASAQSLTTFVTQSRSSKLSELARKYRPTNGQLDLNSNLRLSLEAQRHPMGLAASIPGAADQSQQQFRRRSDAPAGGPLAPPLDGLLTELLGIGKMTTSPRPIDGANSSSSSPLWWQWPEEQRLHQQQQVDHQQQQHRLYMVRMLLGNELLADAIGSLAQQMNWDLVSVIYDDDPELVDLHDELIKQLFTRNIQLALDEQIPTAGAPTETYDKLLLSLAKKSTFGARVVITLLGTGSARLLLDSLHHLRNSISSNPEQIGQVNSLLWISVTDREPYYSFATDALGTIAISSSVSLIPEFRSYYDKLANEQHGAQINKWWPEYIRAILLKHQKDIELVSNECARWQEPKASPLNEKCRSLTLSSLVQFEKSSNHSGSVGGAKSRLMNTAASSSSGGATVGQQAKLAKYLANGWEHNGMDIINSVLAAANGLESIRQTLCPNQQVGLCDRMRELITGGGGGGKTNKLPILSELIYNELLRSTFQLADGRMFNLDDFNSPSGQVEGKFKLYNLRYLQQNSIGFVKFGSYDQMDGLELNTTKARHYPTANSYLDQQPVEMVKSTCEDENKCLMFGALGALNKQQADFSEEELAAGVNSLFKLDHPLLNGPSLPGGDGQQQVGGQAVGAIASLPAQRPVKAVGVAGTDDIGGRPNQQQTIHATPRFPDDSSQVHTMRSAPAMSRFNWSYPSNSTTDQDQDPTEAAAATTLSKGSQPSEQLTLFNTIVLLPLHKGYQSSGGGCSGRLDMEHSFQLLVALAYAQQSVNGAWPPHPQQSGTNSAFHSGDGNDDVFPGAKPQIELTTTVIDYWDQLEMAKTKLLARLVESGKTSTIFNISQQTTNLKQATFNSNSRQLPVVGKTVAVIDFDAQLSENIDNLLEDRQLLHITIGSQNRHLNHQQMNINYNNNMPPQRTIAAGGSGPMVSPSRRKHQHLKLSLMPSKSNEIQALVKLISSMPQWRLVHLIYTDHHHYRDEFVRQANEANICVSKLIWIPSIAVGGRKDNTGFNNGRANEDGVGHSTARSDNGDGSGNVDVGCEAPAGFGDGLEAKKTGTDREAEAKGMDSTTKMAQLVKTRALFDRELHDYSNGSKAAKQQQEPLSDPSGAQGLNSTRVLVILASSSDKTNQLILEAATESMIEDYVWVTSHEWLASVELPAADEKNTDQQAAQRLPRYLLSTRLESYESHGFRHYMSSLSPAIHSPLPSTWFDEFWQQHFRCRLPIPNRGGGANPMTGGSASVDPVCKHHQHLDTQRLIEDDRVHYVIEAIKSLHEALRAMNGTKRTTTGAPMEELSQEFRRSLERGRQLGAHEAHSSHISHLPYGFHIVHRLLPTKSHRANGTIAAPRRANSRNLMTTESRAQGQLLRVGLWRDGRLILLLKKSSSNNNDTTTNSSLVDSSHDNRWWLNSRASTGTDSGMDQDTASSISRSLAKLGAIRSRCSSGQTCALCRQQVEQTMSIIRQEQARLGQSESVAEPNAISSIWSNRQQQPVSLDHMPNSNFDDDDDDNFSNSSSDEDADNEDNSNDNQDAAGGRDIQAAASSLFDGVTSKQVAERQREYDMRRLYGHMTKLQQSRWVDGLQSQISVQLPRTPALLTSMISLVGVIIMVASMTYLYPNMLERAIKRADGVQPGSLINKTGLATHTLSNINDYFLLTGLLMLYSINMAFLLPATMGVCWFRRIGLATSYTVIFSSILVKVLNNCRQSSRKQPHQSSPAPVHHQAQPIKQQQEQQQIDPLEDGVEVTFESLSHDQGLVNAEEDQQKQSAQQLTSNCSTIDHLTNGYQTSDRLGGVAQGLRQQQLPVDKNTSPDSYILGERWYNSRDPATLLTISICLILCQVVVSLVWFIQQPPEPTLYFSCWRCASPIRSPLLFLYEPLLSLLYPSLILVLAWSLSIVAFRLAAQNEEQYRLATKHLLTPQFHFTTNNNYRTDNQLKFKQRQLNHKLRDAKSLVMATTLMVFIWSILTLNMISSNQKLIKTQPLNNGATSSIQQQSIYSTTNPNETTNKTIDNDLTLVYANILSGAILFSFLFIYRLHLFRCGAERQSKTGGSSPTGGSNQRSILKFNENHHQVGGLPEQRTQKWFGTEDMYPVPAGDSFFTGSQFSTARGGRHERLKLQQFNATYGTYSAGPTENYHTSTTINPLHTIGSGSVEGQIDSPYDQAPSSNGSVKRRQKIPSSGRFFGASSPFGGSNKKKRPPIPRQRAFNGTAQSSEFKLQRRQSSGSVASSTAKLVGDNSSMDNDMFMDDTISCASSVASSSTSQLHDGTLNQSGSFTRRSSLRKSLTQANKLSSVSEEQASSNDRPELSLDSGTATTVPDLVERTMDR